MPLTQINLNVEEKYISESFLWNSEDLSNTKVNNFVEHFISDALFDNQIEISTEAFQGNFIVNQIWLTNVEFNSDPNAFTKVSSKSTRTCC